MLNTEEEEIAWNERTADAFSAFVVEHNLPLRRISPAVSKPVSLRIASADLALARRLAAKKGLPYQTYLKSLLHQALARERRKAA